MEEFKPFTIERPWGNFRQFNLNSLATVKILTIKPGEMLSLQSHTKRSEFVKIIHGNGVLEIGENKYNVVEGDEHNIPINTKHRMTAGAYGLAYLEIDMGDFDEEDIIRYEDKYG